MCSDTAPGRTIRAIYLATCINILSRNNIIGIDEFMCIVLILFTITGKTAFNGLINEAMPRYRFYVVVRFTFT